MATRIGGRAWLAALTAVCVITAVPARALQCVPYARAASGIELRGDAWQWWNAAAGIYERGHQPRAGAVMVFRKFGTMRRGHVAVVARTIDSRRILIDHANWGRRAGERGGVATMVAVRDVSPGNDWSQVQVWSAAIQDFGTHAYPTYGFIYPKDESRASVARQVEPRPAGPQASAAQATALETEAPDLILAMLAMPQASPAAAIPAAAVTATPVNDVLAELRRTVPAVDARVDADLFDEPMLEAVAPPAARQSAADGIWEGDRAAALRARSGQY